MKVDVSFSGRSFHFVWLNSRIHILWANWRLPCFLRRFGREPFQPQCLIQARSSSCWNGYQWWHPIIISFWYGVAANVGKSLRWKKCQTPEMFNKMLLELVISVGVASFCESWDSDLAWMVSASLGKAVFEAPLGAGTLFTFSSRV